MGGAGPVPGRSVAPASLERSRRLAEPAMRAAVDRLDPELRRPTRFHLGWADADGTPADGSSGKGVRGALAVLSAEAVGAPGSVGVPAAVAVELVHNFSLVHDDVIDGDNVRHHRPTVWAQFGIGTAIVVGEALHALALEVLLDLDVDAEGTARTDGRTAVGLGARAAAALARATQAMIAGQAWDMAFESRSNVDPDECTTMEAGKTGALIGFAASAGALLAGAPAPQVGALEAFGRHLGIAFQAVDDVLGIWGRPEATGKPVASDLRSRKKSLPVVLALASGTAAAAGLAALYRDAIADDAAVERAVALVEASGAREATEAHAARHLEAALDALGRAQPLVPARDELVDLARFVTARER